MTSRTVLDGLSKKFGKPPLLGCFGDNKKVEEGEIYKSDSPTPQEKMEDLSREDEKMFESHKSVLFKYHSLSYIC